MSRKNPQDYTILTQNKFNEFCTILGIKELSLYDPEKKAIERAFRKRALKTHPDKGGDPIEFKKINDAYYRLMGHISKLEAQAEEQELANSILIEVSKASLPKWIEKLKRTYGWPKTDNCKLVFFEGPYKQFKGRSKNTGPITLVLYEDPPDAIPKIHVISAKYMAWIGEQMLPVYLHVEKGRSIQFEQWRIAHLAEFGICNFSVSTPAPPRKDPPKPAPDPKTPKAKRKAREASEPRTKTRRDSEPTPEPTGKPPAPNEKAAPSATNGTEDKENTVPSAPKDMFTSKIFEEKGKNSGVDESASGESKETPTDPFPKLYNMADQAFEKSGKKPTAGSTTSPPSQDSQPTAPSQTTVVPPVKEEKPFNCGHCGAGFDGLFAYSSHKMKCIPDEDFGLTSDIMDSYAEFNNRAKNSSDAKEPEVNKKENISVEQPVLSSAIPSEKIGKESVEPSVTGKSTPTLNLLTGVDNLIRTKTPDEPAFVCDICKEGFNMLQEYTSHKMDCVKTPEAKTGNGGEKMSSNKNNQEKKVDDCKVTKGDDSIQISNTNKAKSQNCDPITANKNSEDVSHNIGKGISNGREEQNITGNKSHTLENEEGTTKKSEAIPLSKVGKISKGGKAKVSKIKKATGKDYDEEPAAKPMSGHANSTLADEDSKMEPVGGGDPKPINNKIHMESLRDSLPTAQPPNTETEKRRSPEKGLKKTVVANPPNDKEAGETGAKFHQSIKASNKSNGKLDDDAIKLSSKIFTIAQAPEDSEAKVEESLAIPTVVKSKQKVLVKHDNSRGTPTNCDSLDHEAIKLSNTIFSNTTEVQMVDEEERPLLINPPIQLHDERVEKVIEGLDQDAIKLTNLIFPNTTEPNYNNKSNKEEFHMPKVDLETSADNQIKSSNNKPKPSNKVSKVESGKDIPNNSSPDPDLTIVHAHQCFVVNTPLKVEANAENQRDLQNREKEKIVKKIDKPKSPDQKLATNDIQQTAKAKESMILKPEVKTVNFVSISKDSDVKKGYNNILSNNHNSHTKSLGHDSPQSTPKGSRKIEHKPADDSLDLMKYKSRPKIENPDVNKHRPSTLGPSRFENSGSSHYTPPFSNSAITVASSASTSNISSILRSEKPSRNTVSSSANENHGNNDAGTVTTGKVNYSMAPSASFAFGTKSPEPIRRQFDRNFNMSPAPFSGGKYSVHFSESPPPTTSPLAYKSTSSSSGSASTPVFPAAITKSQSTAVTFSEVAATSPTRQQSAAWYPQVSGVGLARKPPLGSTAPASVHSTFKYTASPAASTTEYRAKSEGSGQAGLSSPGYSQYSTSHIPSNTYSLGSPAAAGVTTSSSSGELLRKIQLTKDRHREDCEKAMSYDRGTAWKPPIINVKLPRPGNDYNKYSTNTLERNNRRMEREKAVVDKVLSDRALRSTSLENGKYKF